MTLFWVPFECNLSHILSLSLVILQLQRTEVSSTAHCSLQDWADEGPGLTLYWEVKGHTWSQQFTCCCKHCTYRQVTMMNTYIYFTLFLLYAVNSTWVCLCVLVLFWMVAQWQCEEFVSKMWERALIWCWYDACPNPSWGGMQTSDTATGLVPKISQEVLVKLSWWWWRWLTTWADL